MKRFLNPNEVQLKYSTWELLKDIGTFLKPYRGRFLAGSLLRFSCDLVWLYPAYAFALIVTLLTKYSAGQPLGKVWLLVGLWGLAALWRQIAMFWGKSTCYKIAEQVAIDAQLKTARHLFLLDIAWHEKENSGNKLKRIQNAADGFNRIISMWVNNIIEIAVNFIGMIFIISEFDRLVSVLLVVFLTSYLAISSILTKRAGIAAYMVNIEEERVNGLLFEAVNNIRTVKVTAIVLALCQTLQQHTEELFKKLKLRIFRFQSRSSFLGFLCHAFRLGIIVIIVLGIVHGRYEVGFLILFTNYFNHLWESVSELSDISQDFVVAKYSIARMNDILREPITIDDDRGKTAFPKKWQKIAVKDLSFSYGTNKVLNNLSFEIDRGEKIGIVGLSGAGKSTLFKLLLKEHEGYTGGIFFDNLPIQKIKKTDYFKYVAVVLQDTEVFNFSLRDNITIAGSVGKSDAALLDRSLAIAHVSEFTHKLPQGLDTLIGEKGIKLSGGEKQRLGIARAIFKQPQILLLDEATSHLDLESEEKIQDSLHQFFENVTAVVIAHRLTTIREMNKILVIEDGQIIESGNFDELYKKQGRFFELWEKQKL